ncbi:MAG: DNA repair exonuclease [Thermodesulfobacteria bacterium]|nr:DNA repair exonuclease [Thermodesulfobacteriota bacterium]
MKEINFIHAADLHLGSPFRGLREVDENVSRYMVESTYRAFDSLVDQAIEKAPDFVLFCGDLVDLEDKNLRPLLHLKRGFERLGEASIRVFIVHGNHDPLSKISTLVSFPENVTVFPSKVPDWLEFTTSKGAEVAIWGMSFKNKAERRNLASLLPQGPNEPFKIAMLHCSVGTSANHEPYAQCTLQDLKSKDVDYWALGHIHQPQVISKGPHVVYSGNLQGRSFKEQGPRGCFWVEVDSSQRVELNFCQISKVLWLETEVDISGCTGLDCLSERIFARLKEVLPSTGQKRVIARVILGGTWDISSDSMAHWDLEDVLTDLRQGLSWEADGVFVHEIRNLARPPIDREERARGEDLVAYVFREASRLSLERDGTFEELTKVLEPLLKDRTFRRHCQAFDKGELQELLEEAAVRLAYRLDEKQP